MQRIVITTKDKEIYCGEFKNIIDREKEIKTILKDNSLNECEINNISIEIKR